MNHCSSENSLKEVLLSYLTSSDVKKLFEHFSTCLSLLMLFVSLPHILKKSVHSWLLDFLGKRVVLCICHVKILALVVPCNFDHFFIFVGDIDEGEFFRNWDKQDSKDSEIVSSRSGSKDLGRRNTPGEFSIST